MELVYPDKTKCVKCDACVDICPMRVIAVGEDGYPKAVRNAFKTCINCGYCVDVCACGALTHRVRRKRAQNSDAALRRLKKIKENRRKRGESK